MKIILFIICLVIPTSAFSQELTRVEELTKSEQKALTNAMYILRSAEESYNKLELEIAKEHKMSSEDWPEYSYWYELSGKYILYYQQTTQNTFYDVHKE